MNANPRNRSRRLEPAGELSDPQIEAIVAGAIAAEASAARCEAAAPSSAIVWWRAQMRARQEAAKAADRPVTIVHALAIASSAGLLLSVVGTAAAGMKGSLAWLSGLYASVAGPNGVASIDFSSRWFALPMTAMVVSLLVASVAAYVVLADD
jgi:hypothetical protein